MLQSQVDKLNQELSSSTSKSQELEKKVSELQQYKEQAQVSTSDRNDVKQNYLTVCFFLNVFALQFNNQLCIEWHSGFHTCRGTAVSSFFWIVWLLVCVGGHSHKQKKKLF